MSLAGYKSYTYTLYTPHIIYMTHYIYYTLYRIHTIHKTYYDIRTSNYTTIISLVIIFRTSSIDLIDNR